MFGILMYLVFIVSGLYVSAVLLYKLGKLERIAIGIGICIVMSMWLPTIGALILGRIDTLAIIIGLLLTVVISTLAYLYNRMYIKHDIVNELKTTDYKKLVPIATVVLPFIVLMVILLDGHVLKEIDGALYSGQSTYGDQPMHLGMITSMCKQGIFPPDYSILPGTKLSYPFLVNLQSASMCILGTSLRASVILPAIYMSLSCFLGLYALARSLVNKHRVATLAVCLFFITGGLGFIYFLDSADAFRTIFTGFYKTPTNNPEYNLRWVNIICDMMIPQRTFLAGLSIVLPTILLLKRALDTRSFRLMFLAGTLGASLPIIHTHSFLALGILCGGLLIIGIINEEQSIIHLLKQWGAFLVPVVLFSTPQLLFWIFTQTDGFLRIDLDWVNETNTFLWFWIKNIGLPFMLIIPAFLHANKQIKAYFVSATVIFILAEIVAFQPNTYDNNKLMIIWYVFVCILVADYLIYLYDKAKNIRCRTYFTIITIVVLFLSGVLTIGREIYSNGYYMQFKSHQVDTAKVIDANTPADVLVLTGTQHLNEISSLAGRDIYAGSTIYLYFHGLDYEDRYTYMSNIYEDSEYATTVLADIGVDYMYFSSYERSQFKVDYTIFDKYPLVYTNDEIKILAVSNRAIEIGQLE